MRVLVCGYQRWRDAEAIRTRLADLPADTVVLHPDPTSDDQAWLGALVASIAQDLGLAHEPVAAPGTTLPDDVHLVLAFHSYLLGSSRTKALVDEAKGRSIPVEIFDGTRRREAPGGPPDQAEP
jgi:hypothetical protein